MKPALIVLLLLAASTPALSEFVSGRALDELIFIPTAAPPPTQLRTRAELAAFLTDDRTDEAPYTPAHRCLDFSRVLARNAKAAGFDVRTIHVDFSDGEWHAFTAFVLDRGIVWIEPQSDAEYLAPAVGKPLCRVAGFCWPGEIVRLREIP